MISRSDRHLFGLKAYHMRLSIHNLTCIPGCYLALNNYLSKAVREMGKDRQPLATVNRSCDMAAATDIFANIEFSRKYLMPSAFSVLDFHATSYRDHKLPLRCAMPDVIEIGWCQDELKACNWYFIRNVATEAPMAIW